ncbi:MAG: SdpI family protein [Oscillospiraceae bacterium]
MELLLEYMIPVLLAIYGLKFLIRTPPYKDKGGFATKRALKNEESWRFVHRTAGVCCLVFAAVIVGAGFVLEKVCGADSAGAHFGQMGIEIALIAVLIPVVNLAARIRFGKK